MVLPITRLATTGSSIGLTRRAWLNDLMSHLKAFSIMDAILRPIATLQELEQQRILFAGFGTSDPSLSNGGSADGQNPANINFVEHADELLALWEGGSAHRIDPDTLITQGIKTWSPETAGLPFGAHPKKTRTVICGILAILSHRLP